MKELEIVRADLSKETHRQAVLTITDMYAQDPMGMNQIAAQRYQIEAD